MTASAEIDKDAKEEGEHESVTCTFMGITTFVLGLIGGTFSAVFCKMSFDSLSEGLTPGEFKTFDKPVMILFLMFSGMVPAYFFWLLQQSFRPAFDREVLTPRMMFLLIIPCLCDLLCTLLLLMAQLYITASMWQMLRGTVIIITALLKRTVLNHKLRLHMWIGVLIITVAMVLVACTSLFGQADPSATAKDPRIGVLLVMLGCLAQGVQYVFEEKVMAQDSVPPLVVIGFEGIWGALLSLVVVYPLAYILPGNDQGSLENPFDSIAMIYNSSTLQFLLLAFIVTVTVYNCMAVYVTRYLSSIWHAILDNFRPITIWGADLALFYYLMPGSGFGEEWTSGSWLQLGGLMVLFFGTAVYNGSIMICDHGYSEISTDSVVVENDSMIKTDASMTTAALTRSPMVYKPTQRTGNSFNNVPSPMVSRPPKRPQEV